MPQMGNPNWVKGVAQNPKGKTPGARNKVLVALDQIGADNAEQILREAVAKAKAGDPRFTEILLKRLWPERKGRPIAIELPELKSAADIVAALASIVKATSTGELTPDEANALASVLEMQRKAIETSDIDQRLKAIESLIE